MGVDVSYKCVYGIKTNGNGKLSDYLEKHLNEDTYEAVMCGQIGHLHCYEDGYCGSYEYFGITIFDGSEDSSVQDMGIDIEEFNEFKTYPVKFKDMLSKKYHIEYDEFVSLFGKPKIWLFIHYT